MGKRRKKIAKKTAVSDFSKSRQSQDVRPVENGPLFQTNELHEEYIMQDVLETDKSVDGIKWQGATGVLANYFMMQYGSMEKKCCRCRDRVCREHMPGQTLQDAYISKDEGVDKIDTTDKKEDVEEISRQDYLIIRKSTVRHILKAAVYFFAAAAAAYIIFRIGYHEGVSSVSAWL